MAWNDSTQGYAAADAYFGSAATLAPAAGATICTIDGTAAPVMPAGVYEVVVTVTVGGTVAAADIGNAFIKHGATYVVDVPNGNAGSVTVRIPRLTLPGNEFLRVSTNNAATAGSKYAVTMTATRVM